VRAFVISWCCLAFAGFAATSARAETIRLNNGDVIYADRVEEKGNSIHYEVGDNSYAIPRSKVQSIEAGARPETAASIPQLPFVSRDTSSDDDPRLLQEVVHDGRVDRQALNAIESQGNPSTTAIGYYIAARSEFEGGKLSDARRDLESALRYSPENPAVLNYYAAVLVRTGNARDAISYAERAARIAPDSADALAVLGYAQFAAGHARDAIASWKKSLALRPDAALQSMLARAEREMTIESGYSERETGHFVLRYEGRQSSEAFRTELLQTLEAAYQQLAREFGSEPRAAIQVVLYPNEAFFDVTRAASWTGAINDGRIRIPLQGLTSVTPSLARVLKHELTHSFVNHLAVGRCPQWLNEGIAQMMEPQSLGSRAPRLAQLYKLEGELPLNMLEGSFTSLSGVEAALAYDESLATVEFIRSRYGMGDLLRILERIGHAESAESALRSTLHCDYRQLQDEVRGYLLQISGN